MHILSLSCFCEDDDNPNLPLRGFIEESLFKRIAPEAQWGVYIERLDTGKVVYEKNSHTLFRPASNRKVLTAVLALMNLSPNFMYETKVYRSGEVVGGTLRGDIIVQAAGDPSFHPIYDPRRSYYYPLDNWASEIKKNGITSIAGDVVIDVSAFERFDSIPSGWSWEQLNDSYASPTGAFSVFENCITVQISPGSSAGERANYTLIPNIDSFKIENISETSNRTGYSSVNVIKNPMTGYNMMTGSIGVGTKTQTLRIPMNEPDSQCGSIFKAALERAGIRVGGKLSIIYDSKRIDYQNSSIVLTHSSPDLKRIIKYMLLESNNFFAEQIYKTISAQKSGKGSYESSKIVERNSWSRLGLPLRENVAADGCGLSRSDLFSPYFIAQLLKKVKEKYPDWDFENLLPVSGVSGTLGGRIGKEGYRGKVKAKTGSVHRVSCLSGYLTTQSGTPMVFSIMINNSIGEMGGKMVLIEDKICEKIIREF